MRGGHLGAGGQEQRLGGRSLRGLQNRDGEGARLPLDPQTGQESGRDVIFWIYEENRERLINGVLLSIVSEEAEQVRPMRHDNTRPASTRLSDLRNGLAVLLPRMLHRVHQGPMSLRTLFFFFLKSSRLLAHKPATRAHGYDERLLAD